MTYRDFMDIDPEIELERKRKADLLQQRVLDAASAAGGYRTTYNMRTGHSTIVKEIVRASGVSAEIIMRYKVRGKYYATTNEIENEYNLNSRQAVVVRLRSEGKKWVDWVRL